VGECFFWYRVTKGRKTGVVVVVTNLDHDRQWFNTFIPPSYESTVMCFVCHRFSELRRVISGSVLQLQGWQWKQYVVGSCQNVAFVVNS